MVAIVGTALLTLLVGAFGLRASRTTSDFYVASRSVTPWWNASAIGGEYLSAASFLGIAGLVLAYGADMLWFPVGYAAGYLLLLVLVAAPLRRSGAYTLPDFAESRLESIRVRRAATLLVVAIGWLYLLPQLHAAGLTLTTVTGAPHWVGPLTVAGVVLGSVVIGGMRSITLVQAFQYWLKLTAIAIPALVLIVVWRADGAPDVAPDGPVRAVEQTTVRVSTPVLLDVADTTTLTVDGTLDGDPVAGTVTLEPGTVEIGAGTTLVLEPGTPVPHAEQLRPLDGEAWTLPLQGASEYPLYATYSLILALFLGTMGLPHVLVRFYTNPDGRAARRTTLTVLGLLGVFYLFPTIYGALGRLYTPELLLTGRTEAVVLLLPGALVDGPGGEALTVLVTAGAFAAFLSTASGLTVSVAGVISQDMLAARVRSPVTAFRIGAVLALVAPVCGALLGPTLGIADVVGLAFAVAASSFCPLLVLGIWWRRLTDVGALAGLAVGGGASSAAVLVTIVSGAPPGVAGALLAQPAAWSVPLAFATMIVVSLATPGRVPVGMRRSMVRLHTPEDVHLDRGDFDPEARFRRQRS
ncbi:Na+/solute symporter [Beutenbergia cavernae DSM 12333]|uniref:Na+/solute symporter n=1 Tax=Beutenbergia cavernae (strain ATCC BAA-8 / DSM 12333 / CCUG 43141 / JCM 11478 / NBRC 16432 / NCIMB 13614 / HKI 0122) TaxID=471853 RepID=C5C1K7_BEUC1|nr:Na+/solute symporter [Beutenbergia cavernae DSM 12333]